jgi:hypothetical protein
MQFYFIMHLFQQLMDYLGAVLGFRLEDQDELLDEWDQYVD